MSPSMMERAFKAAMVSMERRPLTVLEQLTAQLLPERMAELGKLANNYNDLLRLATKEAAERARQIIVELHTRQQ